MSTAESLFLMNLFLLPWRVVARCCDFHRFVNWCFKVGEEIPLDESSLAMLSPALENEPALVAVRRGLV